MISIIIPVYNEPTINATILELRKQNFAQFEIIVVDGQQHTTTLDLIEDPQVIKLVSRPGRAVQMNAGAKRASGDILLFLHADCKLPCGGLRMIDRSIKSGFKTGAFDIWFQSKNWLLREVISRTASLRSRLIGIPYGDQGQFFRKDYFEDLGGYAEIPLMEDIQIMKKLKIFNERVHIIPHRVTASARRWEEEGMLYVLLRNPILSGLYFLGVHPDKLVKFYPKQNKGRRE